MDQNDQFDRFDQTDFSRFESSSDTERAVRRDRTERPHSGGSRSSSVRPVRSGIRMGKGRPVRRPIRINYRLVLCIAVLVLFVLTIIFGTLSHVRGRKISDLNTQIETLNKDKDNLSAQVGTLTQENQTLQTSITATLPAPKAAETNSIADLIPQLSDGIYVVQSTGSQLRYLSVPEGYLQNKLGEYRDDASGYSATDGSAPVCTYYVLFTDRVIGLAEGNTGFVSTDRTAAGNATTTPAGFYDFVASFFNNSNSSTSTAASGTGTDSTDSASGSDSSTDTAANG